jgi:hypothetical protein
MFFLLQKGSERISEIFLFSETAGTDEQTNYSVYSVFRGIIFLSEIANLNWNSLSSRPTPNKLTQPECPSFLTSLIFFLLFV